jgi:four helix bundle protein
MALPETGLGKHIQGQPIRCSTSVAANYRARCLSQSKASFIAKLNIVLEEAGESAFWLEFIIDENLLKENMVKNPASGSTGVNCNFRVFQKEGKHKK